VGAPAGGPIERDVSPRRVSWLRLGVAAAVLLAGVAAYAFLVEPRALRVERVRVACPDLAVGPVRIAVFSDVAFPGAPTARERLLEEAGAFDPDLVFVAGDFLNDRPASVGEDVLASARQYLDALPAAGRRFLAPGEAESPDVELLRRVWPEDTVRVATGERDVLRIGGARLDLFVADRKADPAPWGLSRDAGRDAAFSFGRGAWTRLASREPVVPAGEFEVEFSFRLDESRAYFAVTVEPEDPRAPGGFRIVRYEDRPTFRVTAPEGRSLRAEGRTESGWDPPEGSWCRARVRYVPGASDAALRARFWRERDPEPSGWAIDATIEGSGAARKGLAFTGRAGTRRIASLRVEAGGREVFSEAFSDLASFRERWVQPSRLAAWLGEAPDGARILLIHDPDVVREVAGLTSTPPCLVIAGHTHGGQVRLPLVGPLHVGTHLGRRYARGLLDWRGVPLLITSGVGTSVIPARLGVPPEIVLLTLEPAP
jgi:predicted MPP superfamily phosphohydrolase